MAGFDVPHPDYDPYSNRQLMAIPLALLVLAVLIVGGATLLFGAPAPLGIEFTGGTELTVQTTSDADEIRDAFDRDVEQIRSIEGQDNQYILTFRPDDAAEDDDLQAEAEGGLAPDGDSDVIQGVREFDATFAEQTQSLALLGLVVAFIGMSVLAFVLFRVFVPSVTIVVATFSNLMIPLAVMSLFRIELNLGTVAALLMLIGYSVDSDILLNNHVLRRCGSFYESASRAMDTGVTMSITSASAMAVMAIVAWFYGIDLLSSIGLILFIGICSDLMNKYTFNIALLRWYKFEGVNR